MNDQLVSSKTTLIDCIFHLKAESHLFITSIKFNDIAICSALNIVSHLKREKKDAKLLIYDEHILELPLHWNEDFFVRESSFDYKKPPKYDKVWLWDIDHYKHLKQDRKENMIEKPSLRYFFEESNDIIQIYQKNQLGKKRRGRHYLEYNYPGGIAEFTYNLSRELMFFDRYFLNLSLEKTLDEKPDLENDLNFITLLT